MFKEDEKKEHEEIIQAFKYLKKAREIFEIYSGEHKYFSGNDNHVGDIGEYWAFRYYSAIGEKPKLADKKTSKFDIELTNKKCVSVKTMSEWNKSKQGGGINGLREKTWDDLVLVKLNAGFEVEKFCIIPKEILIKKKISQTMKWRWWKWPDEESYDKTKDFNKKIALLKRR